MQFWKTKLFVIVGALALIGVFSGASWAKTEVVWWHAQTGFLGDRLMDITKKFNASQNEYEVKAIYKGGYPETLTAGIAAYRAKTHPHIIQVFEVGTQTMLLSGAIYPVFQLMKEQVSAEILTELMQGYIRQKRHDAALAVVRKRIAENPHDAFAQNLLGWVYTALKNYQEAEGALKKAIEMQPLWPAPHTNLANLYLLQGRKAEAAGKFEAAIGANPKVPAGYLSLALLYERDKDYGNAKKVYERAIKENPNFWFAANNLAFLLTETSTGKEELTRAKTLAEEAIRQRPNEPALTDTGAGSGDGGDRAVADLRTTPAREPLDARAAGEPVRAGRRCGLPSSPALC